MCIPSFLSVIANAKAEIEAYKKALETLPPKEREEFREMRRAYLKQQSEHAKKLEIAREGRSLNFWGYR